MRSLADDLKAKNWRIDDAQLRKERREADMPITRVPGQKSKYSLVLDHESELAIWTVWKSLNGRWYGTNDLDDRVVDAPTLAGAKLDIRLCNFPSLSKADRRTL